MYRYKFLDLCLGKRVAHFRLALSSKASSTTLHSPYKHNNITSIPSPIPPQSSHNHVETIRFTGTASSSSPHKQTSLTLPADDHLLPRRPSLPSRIRTGSHLARRHSIGHISKRWHRVGSRAQGHEQAVRAGYIGREAVHPQ